MLFWDMALFGIKNRKGLHLVVTDRTKAPLWSRIRRPSTRLIAYAVLGAIAAGLFAFNAGGSDTESASRNMPICAGAKRVNCVVDGDTIWLDGEKIRLESFNTPEVNGQCDRERQLARQATLRLSQILSSQPFTVARSGYDRYGRRLALISTGSGNVGDMLIRERLAHEWRGRKETWCG